MKLSHISQVSKVELCGPQLAPGSVKETHRNHDRSCPTFSFISCCAESHLCLNVKDDRWDAADMTKNWRSDGLHIPIQRSALLHVGPTNILKVLGVNEGLFISRTLLVCETCAEILLCLSVLSNFGAAGVDPRICLILMVYWYLNYS